MDCERALEAVSAALDGELTEAEQVQLEAHLSACPGCRALAEELSALNAALEENEPAPPPSLAEQVMERIAGQSKVVHLSAKRRQSTRRWAGLAAALALVVCAGGLGLWFRGGVAETGGAPMAYTGDSFRSNGAAGGDERVGGDASKEAAVNDGISAEPPPNTTSDGDVQPAPAMAAPSDDNRSSPCPGAREPGSGPESSEPSAKSPTGSAEDAAAEQEKALNLVFEHLGGYGSYPEAKLRYTTTYGTSMPAYCLKVEEEAETTSEYCLDYVRISSNALYHEIHLYENVTYEEENEGEGNSTVTCNWFAVDIEGSGEILAEFPEDYDAERELEYIDSYVNAVTGD